MQNSNLPTETEFENNQKDDWLFSQEVYGIDANVKSPLFFLDKENFGLIVGCNLSILNLRSHRKKLVHLNFKERIEIMYLTLNKQYLLFVDCEKKRSNIYLYDVSEKNENKSFKQSNGFENEMITDICISSNTELIACHAINGTDRNLMIISLNKLKLLAQAKVVFMNGNNENKVKKIDFFPNDNKRILLLGHKLIKIYLYTPNSGIKSVLNFDCHIYLEFFSWLSKNEIISFDKYGHLYLIEPKQNIIRSLNLNQKNHDSNLTLNEKRSLESNGSLSGRSSFFKNYLKPIKRIVCVQKGFFMLHLNDEIVKYYKIEETEMFVYNLVFSINLTKEKSQKNATKSFKEIILDICINETHTLILALTNFKKIYFYDLNDMLKRGVIDKQFGEFELILDNYHYDNITGLDYSINKPVIVTCSLDRALTIYNYDTNLIELRQYFEDDLFGVTIHPTGLYLILSTAKCLKYMCVYLDSFKVIHVLNVRSCTTCIYSNNGHLFAFVHGTVIKIYSSLKFKEIGSIKGHDMGKIRQLCFSHDDHYLLCCSMAGIIRVLNSNTLTIICEITTKGLSYTGLAMHPNMQWLFLISTEKSIRQFEFITSSDFKSSIKPNCEVKLLKKFETKHTENVTCLHMNKSGKIICIGTNKGSIRIFRLPEGEYKEYRAHSYAITKLCITCNDEFLIASSEDGTLIFWKINEKLRTLNIINQFTEEVLIDKNALLKSAKTIEINENKISNFLVETDFVCMLKELHSTIKKNDLSKRLNEQLNEVKIKIENESSKEETITNMLDLNLKDLKEDQMNKIKILYESFESKIEMENDKNNEIMKDIINLKDKVTINKSILEEMKLRNEKDQFENIEKKLETIRNGFSHKISSFSAQIKDLIDFESDFKEEISNQKLKLERDFLKKLNELKSVNDNLKIESSCLTTEINYAEQSIQLFNKNFFNSEVKLKTLIENSKKLDFDVQNLASENDLKEKTLMELENRLKVLNAECEMIEVLNLNHENKFESEYKLLVLENEKCLVIKKEVEKEIKMKKNELSNLRARVNNHRFKK